jgi:hypothetical protein
MKKMKMKNKNGRDAKVGCEMVDVKRWGLMLVYDGADSLSSFFLKNPP